METTPQPQQPTHEQSQEDEYLKWVQGEATQGPIDPQRPAEVASVRGSAPEVNAATLTEQQMAVSAADRAIREEAGLPPRTHDLR